MRLTIERRLNQPWWLTIVVPIGSVVFALLVAAVILLITGHPPVETYRKLFDAAFVQTGSINQTLIAATPLAFTGLAAAAAFRMRLYNIGGEGQLYIGAIFGAGIGLLVGGDGSASPLVIGAMVLAGGLGGALWAGIPGVLRAYLGTSEILTSLMLNYVAAYVLTYLIFQSQSYWRDTTGFNATVFPAGKQLPANAVWPATTVHTQGGIAIPLGAFVAIGAAIVLWALYKRTRFGFEVQVLGDSEGAARYAGVSIRRKVVAVMAISGAIAGIGGASQVGDFSHALDGDPNGLQKQAYGYSGIVIAALGRYNPLAVLLVAFLIGGLDNAGNTLQGADFPSGLVGVIQGIILFGALGGELLVRHRVRIARTGRVATGAAG